MRKRARPIASDPALIVVADADGAAARLLATHLTSRGLKAVHARAGRKVLSLARSGGLALAILDVVLEDMSGPALAVRLQEFDPAIPILMTSADHRSEVEIRARQAGIVYYAHKPTEGRVLEAVVAKALARRNERRGRSQPLKGNGKHPRKVPRR